MVAGWSGRSAAGLDFCFWVGSVCFWVGKIFFAIKYFLLGVVGEGGKIYSLLKVFKVFVFILSLISFLDLVLVVVCWPTSATSIYCILPSNLKNSFQILNIFFGVFFCMALGWVFFFEIFFKCSSVLWVKFSFSGGCSCQLGNSCKARVPLSGWWWWVIFCSG